MDGGQQAVSSSQIHSIMILEWTSNYALDWSTDASLLGMGDAALALSSWLSTLEGPELLFDWARDSLFGVFLLPLRLFLLGLLAFKLIMSKLQQYSS